MEYKERLKFYADTGKEKNKYFCFQIVSILALKEALWRFFDKGWNIRAAWYEKIDCKSGEIKENQKLEINNLLEEYLLEKTNKSNYILHKKQNNLY